MVGSRLGATASRAVTAKARLAQLLGGLVLIGLLAGAWIWRDVPQNWWEARSGRRPLLAAKTWYYHLARIDVDRIARSDADVLVIDYARNDGMVPLTRDEVARLKVKPDGSKRIVISYISIGEAESYRFYWNTAWSPDKGNMPAWHIAENCAWPRNHAIRFWHEDWRRIIYKGPESYIKRIVDAGFDGVYLDRVDIYWQEDNLGPETREQMIGFVGELAAAGRALKPGFLVIPQNAEDLLEQRRYRRLIDGLGKEDLLHGHSNTGVRNAKKVIDGSLGHLRKLLWDWKPVLAVEYLTTRERIEATRGELQRLGMVPTFAHRSLDGSDPTGPPIATEVNYGTPEWIAENCKTKKWW